MAGTLNRRCEWATHSDAMRDYHDTEWGIPSRDDVYLFELLTLEGAQAGLSWATILKKRENYRRLFAQFDPAKVARFSETKQAALLLDAGIVRNRLKIESTISNAAVVRRMQAEHGSFANYVWSHVDDGPVVNRWQSSAELPAKTTLSDRVSRDMKKQGFRFVGSTTVYAFLQAVGVIDDHIVGCIAKPR